MELIYCSHCDQREKLPSKYSKKKCIDCHRKIVREATARRRRKIGCGFVEKRNYLEKYCKMCDKTKPTIEFNRDKYTIDGHTYNCKLCRKFMKKRYYSTEEAKIHRRNVQNKRRREDNVFRLQKNVSVAIANSLANRNGSKNGRSVWSKLPYTLKQLKEHLEKQFDENMSWDNYGSYWHIDHIYPKSKLLFDSFDHKNFLVCWDLNNLRPLEAKANISKHDKVLNEQENKSFSNK